MRLRTKTTELQVYLINIVKCLLVHTPVEVYAFGRAHVTVGEGSQIVLIALAMYKYDKREFSLLV